MIADYVRRRAACPRTGLRVVQPGDLEAIAAPTDFLGVNYYTAPCVRSETVPEADNLPRTVFPAPESEWTEMGWEVYPEGLYQIAVPRPPRLRARRRSTSPRTAPAIRTARTRTGACTTSGASASCAITSAAARRAIDAGVPLAGYFVWSLLDNFEWERGYTQRFGIVWVDYDDAAAHPEGQRALVPPGHRRRVARSRLIESGGPPMKPPPSAPE